MLCWVRYHQQRVTPSRCSWKCRSRKTPPSSTAPTTTIPQQPLEGLQGSSNNTTTPFPQHQTLPTPNPSNWKIPQRNLRIRRNEPNLMAATPELAPLRWEDLPGSPAVKRKPPRPAKTTRNGANTTTPRVGREDPRSRRVEEELLPAKKRRRKKIVRSIAVLQVRKLLLKRRREMKVERRERGKESAAARKSRKGGRRNKNWRCKERFFPQSQAQISGRMFLNWYLPYHSFFFFVIRIVFCFFTCDLLFAWDNAV